MGGQWLEIKKRDKRREGVKCKAGGWDIGVRGQGWDSGRNGCALGLGWTQERERGKGYR